MSNAENIIILSNQLAIDVIAEKMNTDSKEYLMPVLLLILRKELNNFDITELNTHYLTRRLMVLVFKNKPSFGDSYHEAIEEIVIDVKEKQIDSK